MGEEKSVLCWAAVDAEREIIALIPAERDSDRAYADALAVSGAVDVEARSVSLGPRLGP